MRRNAKGWRACPGRDKALNSIQQIDPTFSIQSRWKFGDFVTLRKNSERRPLTVILSEPLLLLLLTDFTRMYWKTHQKSLAKAEHWKLHWRLLEGAFSVRAPRKVRSFFKQAQNGIQGSKQAFKSRRRYRQEGTAYFGMNFKPIHWYYCSQQTMHTGVDHHVKIPSIINKTTSDHDA